MSDKKKVLIVNEPLQYGGMNLASIRFEENLDKSKFECVYCVRRDKKGVLEQGVLDRGVRVIHVPDSEINYFKSYRFYKNLMTNEHFDIVHCHLPFFSGIVLLAAERCGVERRAAHAHFSQPYTDTEIYSKSKQLIASVYRRAMRLLLKKYCNIKIGCSREAGEFLFGKKEFAKHGIVLNNGIDTKKYFFNQESRIKTRNELSIPQDSVVLGHIGQMYSVKNQSFLLDVFNNYIKTNPNSHLLLIGEGTDEEKLSKKTESLNLNENVHFLGARNDVPELLSAMDCFVFPSLHEGFPLTLIEAQASKLACVVSDTVTRYTMLNSNFSFVSLKSGCDVWCEEINRVMSVARESVDTKNVINNFDIKNIAKELEKIY